MLNDRKANSKGEGKLNKIIKKNGEENPKQNKQQIGKVKKSVNAGLVETSPIVEATLPIKNKGNKKPKAKKEVLEEVTMESEAEDAVEQSEVESDEDSETEESAEGLGHTVFVSNIPAKTKRTELVKCFSTCGKIMSIIFSGPQGVIFTPTVQTAHVKAFIVFDSVKAADNALKLIGTPLNGQQLIVQTPRDTYKPVSNISNKSDNSNTALVTNLNPKTNKNNIKKLFSSCGKIAFINFIKNFDSKGKAFVCFKSPVAVDLALKLNGTELDENTIQVAKYSDKLNNKAPKLSVDKAGLKNLGKGELKEKMLEVGQKYVKIIPDKKNQGKKNSEFRKVKSEGIKKAPKKKANKNAASS